MTETTLNGVELFGLGALSALLFAALVCYLIGCWARAVVRQAERERAALATAGDCAKCEVVEVATGCVVAPCRDCEKCAQHCGCGRAL